MMATAVGPVPRPPGLALAWMSRGSSFHRPTGPTDHGLGRPSIRHRLHPAPTSFAPRRRPLCPSSRLLRVSARPCSPARSRPSGSPRTLPLRLANARLRPGGNPRCSAPWPAPGGRPPAPAPSPRGLPLDRLKPPCLSRPGGLGLSSALEVNSDNFIGQLQEMRSAAVDLHPERQGRDSTFGTPTRIFTRTWRRPGGG